MSLKILVAGDVVGSPGRELVRGCLMPYARENQIDFVIVNGENAAGGLGISTAIANQFFEWGVDVITTGDHVWKKRDIATLIQADIRILRPANFPQSSPGRGWTCVTTVAGVPIGVVNLVGRVFMKPAECPFEAADRAVQELSEKTSIILVDMHAEATSEKVAMGWHLNGRVSAVFGTHTHIQTADEKILSGGTAYITDIGMTGGHKSVLGRKVEPVVSHFITNLPQPFDVSGEDPHVSGAIITIDTGSGKATAIERIFLAKNEAK